VKERTFEGVQFPIRPGTTVWVAPFYNRSGYGVLARSIVWALHRAGMRIRTLSVDQVEPGIDDTDIGLIKSLESTALIPPITAIISHVPSKIWLTMKLPEPNLRIILTTFDSSAQGNLPPAEWLAPCKEMDQVWVMSEKEREAFLSTGLPPEKIQVIYPPHPWMENPLLPPPVSELAVPRQRFRFLSIAMFLPRRRWDTMIQAYLEEFKDNEGIEIYLKVNYPSWHPVPGKPRQDFHNLVKNLREKTRSPAPLVIDEELGTRKGIVHLIDSCNVYVSTDTASTGPVSEARVRQRMLVMPEGLGLGMPEDWYVPITVDPQAKIPMTPEMLFYQPHHKGTFMPQLDVEDVRSALRRAYEMTPEQRQEAATKADCIPGPAETIPMVLKAINLGWQHKELTKKQTSWAQSHPEAKACSTNFYLIRNAGMGDVLMALPAARALKRKNPAAKVVLLTEKRYENIIRANPYVDECITVEGSKLSVQGDSKTLQGGRGWDLNPARFGIGEDHQVDAYLKELGIRVPDENKEIVLQIPASSVEKVNRLLEEKINSSPLAGDGRRPKIVLLHAAKNDPNRTWPAPRWERLAQIIMEEGYLVIATGDKGQDPRRGVHDIHLPGVVNLVDQLSPLEFTALCRKANLLITTDSGAVQLAGPSNIGIAGIYTVIPGRCRLPYRHGKPMWNSVSIESECEYSGCYRRMLEEKHFGPARERLKAGKMTAPQLFAEWCLAREKYACLLRLITPEIVWQKSKNLLLQEPRIWNELGEALFQKGKVEEAKHIFQGALERESNFPPALNNLGVISFQGGKLKEAISYFNRVLDVKPDDFTALENMGMCLASENEFRQAIDCFERAREYGPGDAELLNSLGNCLIQTENFSRAEEIYQTSLQRDPNQALVKKILQDLQRVQGRQRPEPLPG
jgi:ADP-heptose:LPS heptosyltransferase/Flp pilus assembly protein TadD/glycosyltransferase involved in cell wall biosynthesis